MRSFFIILFVFTHLNYAQIRVYLPQIIADKNSTIGAPVLVDNLDNQNVKAFQFTLFYDPEIITITGISLNGTLLEGKFFPAYNADTLNGRFLVAWADQAPLSNSGFLLYLVTHIKKDGKAVLSFDHTFTFNNGTPKAEEYEGFIMTSITSVTDDVSGVPFSYSLEQNYPNPFNPVTTIKFGLPVESHVKLRIFDLLGREIALVADSRMSAGYHYLNFDASSLMSGVYLYRLEADDFVQIKKMILLK